MFGIDDVGVSQLPCSFTLYKLSFNQSFNFSRAFPHHQFDCYSIDIIYEENWASINMEWPSVARNLYKVLWKSISCFEVLLLGYRERHNNPMSVFECECACAFEFGFPAADVTDSTRTYEMCVLHSHTSLYGIHDCSSDVLVFCWIFYIPYFPAYNARVIYTKKI
jgi:hypothetical protein